MKEDTNNKKDILNLLDGLDLKDRQRKLLQGLVLKADNVFSREFFENGRFTHLKLEYTIDSSPNCTWSGLHFVTVEANVVEPSIFFVDIKYSGGEKCRFTVDEGFVAKDLYYSILFNFALHLNDSAVYNGQLVEYLNYVKECKKE